MSLITPANMFRQFLQRDLRNLIKPELIYVIDCSNVKVFDDVITSPAITVYEKGNESDVLIYQEMTENNEIKRLL
jgi:hypothetical protein